MHHCKSLDSNHDRKHKFEDVFKRIESADCLSNNLDFLRRVAFFWASDECLRDSQLSVLRSLNVTRKSNRNINYGGNYMLTIQNRRDLLTWARQGKQKPFVHIWSTWQPDWALNEPTLFFCWDLISSLHKSPENFSLVNIHVRKEEEKGRRSRLRPMSEDFYLFLREQPCCIDRRIICYEVCFVFDFR